MISADKTISTNKLITQIEWQEKKKIPEETN